MNDNRVRELVIVNITLTTLSFPTSFFVHPASWDKLSINAPLSCYVPNIHVSKLNQYRITEYISGESLNVLLQVSANQLETYHNQLCSLIEHFETRLAEMSIKNTELYPRMPDMHDNKRFKQALPTLRKHLPGTLVESLAHFIPQHQHPRPARLLANDINFFNLIIDRDGIWTLFDFELFAFSRNKESIALTLSPLLYDFNLLERGLVCLRDRYKGSAEYPSIRKTILSFLCNHLYLANLFVSGKWKSPRFPIEQERNRFNAIRHCLLNLAETL